MIKDGMGNEIKVGDQVLCGIGNQMFVGRVKDIVRGGGGMTLALRPGLPPTPPKLDHITLTMDVEVDLMDIAPGKNHPALYKLLDPARERVVPKGD
jgi:hypothetical protein